MEIIRFITHYGMHFLIPGVIAFIFFKNKWKIVWLIFIATMLIDIDHLWATPIFDANRCSINFHFFHTSQAAIVYLLLLIPKKTRIVGIALLYHLFTDYIDCFWIK